MDQDRLRREICFEAARLLQARRESDYGKAKWRAARSITSCYIPSDAMPTDYEIRQSLQQLVTGENETLMTPGSGSSEHRYDVFRTLLLPLDRVRQNRDSHPEGDVLYHSLQVFELARENRPWDEEFLLAALLHDVGKGIDPRDHVAAGLALLGEYISERTRWLIENHSTAQRILDGSAGARARRRLTTADDGDALDLLAACDRNGRLPGRAVCTIDEALDFIRTLERENEEQPDSERGEQ
jgi:HD domain